MEIILSILGSALGIVSIGMTWYFGTKSKRLKKKIEQHEKKLEKLEGYAKITGYKSLLHDSFHSISYALGVFLITLGVKSLLVLWVTNETAIQISNGFFAGAYIGSGLVLMETFADLTRAFKPEESISILKNKIDDKRSEIEQRI